jgi:SAM-dependent methyltransferase
MRCPGCASPAPEVFFRVPSVPALSNQLFPTREAALGAPRGEIALAHCPACGLIANAAFDPARVRYTGAYENALHFSPRFRVYAEALARDLIARHDIRGKQVIEIGCGDGAFLALLCRLGGNRGVGFDLAHDAARAAPLPAGVTILSRQFRDEDADLAPALVCCRHVLEHVPDPVAFLGAVRRLAGARARTVVFVEVPNVLYTLDRLGIWDIVYEHCLYLSPRSLERLIVAAGLRPTRARVAYDGQFLTIEARPAARSRAGQAPGPASARRPAERSDVAALVAGFARAHRDKVAEWRGVLERIARDGTRAVVWGAGSKGVTFLNMLEASGTAVACVVDVNPRKHGCHVAGTGHAIVPPARLVDVRPGLVIAMNPLYREEIEADLRRLGISARVLAA